MGRKGGDVLDEVLIYSDQTPLLLPREGAGGEFHGDATQQNCRSMLQEHQCEMSFQ